MKNRTAAAASILLFALFLLLAGGCRTDTDTRQMQSGRSPAASPAESHAPGTSEAPGAPAPPPGKLLLPEGYPYDGKPVYSVGGRPVTEEELRRFSKRFLSSPEEHAKQPAFLPEKVIPSFARYWAVVRMGMERGVPDTPRVRNVVEVYRFASLANDYRSNLVKSIPVPESATRAAVPDDWTRMEFSVVTFPDPKEAEKFREEVLAKRKTLGKGEFAKYIAETFRNRSGKVFRGSGFFAAHEEGYLYGLSEGDVSRPVDTGIGRGVCYVVSRERLEGKAREGYLEQVRNRYREQEADARLKSIVGKARYTVHKDNVAQAVRIEGTTGMQAELTVLTLHSPQGDVALAYRDFRNLVPSNYMVFYRSYPQESWINFVLPEVENLAHLYEIGREAAHGGAALDPKWAKELFDFRGKTIYNATLDGIAKESPVSVTDAEVEKYYKRNRGFFDRQETVRIRYVYAPQREALEGLVRQAGSRENIFTKKEHRDLVKERYVWDGNATHEELFKALKSVNVGAVSPVVKADMGFYVAKVEERREKGFLPLSEVSGQIRQKLLEEKRGEKVREAVNARMSGFEIRKI